MSRKDKEKQIPEEELMTEVPEEPSENETETAEETSGQDGDALKKELEEANAKTAEYLAMAQRVQADFENYRKRNETVRADAFADGRREVAAAMLPVLDNLERAVGAAADSVDEALKNGMELVLKQMTDIYQKMDVTPIDRKGERFDPNLENAVLQGTAEEGEPGTVCQVLQKGYRMGDRVLRHAMVKVVAE
ncbi:nucleotide exchange factor GrpE [Clostridiales bacterium]|nr:nucleotide exchange factor GrpE [Clostridiales bacterium]